MGPGTNPDDEKKRRKDDDKSGSGGDGAESGKLGQGPSELNLSMFGNAGRDMPAEDASVRRYPLRPREPTPEEERELDEYAAETDRMAAEIGVTKTDLSALVPGPPVPPDHLVALARYYRTPDDVSPEERDAAELVRENARIYTNWHAALCEVGAEWRMEIGRELTRRRESN